VRGRFVEQRSSGSRQTPCNRDARRSPPDRRSTVRSAGVESTDRNRRFNSPRSTSPPVAAFAMRVAAHADHLRDVNANGQLVSCGKKAMRLRESFDAAARRVRCHPDDGSPGWSPQAAIARIKVLFPLPFGRRSRSACPT